MKILGIFTKQLSRSRLRFRSQSVKPEVQKISLNRLSHGINTAKFSYLQTKLLDTYPCKIIHKGTGSPVFRESCGTIQSISHLFWL